MHDAEVVSQSFPKQIHDVQCGQSCAKVKGSVVYFNLIRLSSTPYWVRITRGLMCGNCWGMAQSSRLLQLPYSCRICFGDMELLRVNLISPLRNWSHWLGSMREWKKHLIISSLFLISGVGMILWSFRDPQIETSLARQFFISILGFVLVKW